MRHIRSRLRNLLLGLVSLSCLAFTAGVAYVLIVAPEVIEAPIVGRFDLVDTTGNQVTEATFQGRYLLVYFGYTFCPDICPTELARMAAALDSFAETAPDRATKIVPIFISIDPDRDTPETLKDYRALFHPRLIALTGSKAQLRAASGNYKVFYVNVLPKDGDAKRDYLMDHSSQIYLMGPDARYLTHFTSGATVDAIVAELGQRVR